MSEDCVFCQIVEREAPADIYWEWSHALAFTPLNPVVPGHLLVIPKNHAKNAAANPFDASGAFLCAAELAERIGDCNIITSVGEAATQTVLHTHIHIVPRRAGDEIKLPWSPVSQTADRPCGKGVQDEFEAEMRAVTDSASEDWHCSHGQHPDFCGRCDDEQDKAVVDASDERPDGYGVVECDRDDNHEPHTNLWCPGLASPDFHTKEPTLGVVNIPGVNARETVGDSYTVPSSDIPSEDNMEDWVGAEAWVSPDKRHASIRLRGGEVLRFGISHESLFYLSPDTTETEPTRTAYALMAIALHKLIEAVDEGNYDGAAMANARAISAAQREAWEAVVKASTVDPEDDPNYCGCCTPAGHRCPCRDCVAEVH